MTEDIKETIEDPDPYGLRDQMNGKTFDEFMLESGIFELQDKDKEKLIDNLLLAINNEIPMKKRIEEFIYKEKYVLRPQMTTEGSEDSIYIRPNFSSKDNKENIEGTNLRCSLNCPVLLLGESDLIAPFFEHVFREMTENAFKYFLSLQDEIIMPYNIDVFTAHDKKFLKAKIKNPVVNKDHAQTYFQKLFSTPDYDKKNTSETTQAIRTLKLEKGEFAWGGLGSLLINLMIKATGGELKPFYCTEENGKKQTYIYYPEDREILPYHKKIKNDFINPREETEISNNYVELIVQIPIKNIIGLDKKIETAAAQLKQ